MKYEGSLTVLAREIDCRSICRDELMYGSKIGTGTQLHNMQKAIEIKVTISVNVVTDRVISKSYFMQEDHKDDDVVKFRVDLLRYRPMSFIRPYDSDGLNEKKIKSR